VEDDVKVGPGGSAYVGDSLVVGEEGIYPQAQLVEEPYHLFKISFPIGIVVGHDPQYINQPPILGARFGIDDIIQQGLKGYFITQVTFAQKTRGIHRVHRMSLLPVFFRDAVYIVPDYPRGTA
jgi:hypothetical protein